MRTRKHSCKRSKSCTNSPMKQMNRIRTRVDEILAGNFNRHPPSSLAFVPEGYHFSGPNPAPKGECHD